MALIDLVRKHYASMASGDPAMIFADFAEEFTWIETAGSFNGGTYRSAEDIVQDVFARIDHSFASFRFEPERFIIEVDAVAVTGQYLIGDEETPVRTLHLWTGDEQKIVSFEQFTDSATLNGLRK